MDEARIGDGANVVMMTDGGENRNSTYAAVARDHPGMVQHEAMAHGHGVWGRSCLVRTSGGRVMELALGHGR